MVSAAYSIGIDINKDGYFADDVWASDPISILYYGGYFKDIRTTVIATSGDTLTRVGGQRDLAYGTVYYRYSGNGTAPEGWYFGYDGTASFIDCLPSTQYTFVFWYRGIFGYSGKNLQWYVTGNTSGSSSTESVSIASSNWAQTSITFTTGATDTRVWFTISHDSLTAISFDCTGFMIVPGASAPTAFNSGSGSDIHENFTTLVQHASWSNGLQSAYEELAGDNRLTLVLDNKDGHWNQDYVAAEVLTNGGFDNWTAGVLDNWTEAYTTSGTADITEVGTALGYGGGGTGSANFASTTTSFPAYLRLIQAGVLTVGKRYKVTAVCSYNDDSLNYFQFYCGSNPVSVKYSALGTKTFYFTAMHTDFTIRAFISTPITGTLSLTLDSVSVEEVPRYYGIDTGALVWIRSTYSSVERNLCTMWLDSITPNIGRYNAPTVTLDCVDAMPALLNAEYVPDFQLGVQINDALENVLDRVNFTYPYISYFWMLGQEGGSRLEDETYLFDVSDAVSFRTSDTVLDYVGDIASSEEKGISAQAYLRDLLAAEFGGRFYWDARQARFKFINRRYDAEIVSASSGSAFSDDDFDDADYRRADDIINSVKAYYNQRSTGQSTEVLWSSPNSIEVQPDQTKTITARYHDPTQEAVQIAAYSTEPLAPGTDYTITPANAQPRVEIAVTADAQSATFQIHCSATQRSRTVNNLQIRGLRINKYDRQFIEVIHPDSLFKRNKKEISVNIPVVSNATDVLNHASALVEHFHKPITRFESITWFGNKDNLRMIRAQSDNLNSVFTITTTNGHNMRYATVGEKHELIAGGEQTHRVTVFLKPSERLRFWSLGKTGYSELGSTTLPAF